MTCLQDNLEHLREDCLAAVLSYTKVQAQNTRLNMGVARACHDIIDKQCSEEVRWKVSKLESVRIGKSQNWKVPEQESVRTGKCLNKKGFVLKSV